MKADIFLPFLICCTFTHFRMAELGCFASTPNLGTNAEIFLPFLIYCTLTHFRTAELGCLASTPSFSSTCQPCTRAVFNPLGLPIIAQINLYKVVLISLKLPM